jgi:hypothetical protein
MTIVNKTIIISKDRDSDNEFIDLIRNQGPIVYYQMNKDVTGLNISMDRITVPINPYYITCAIDLFERGYINYDINDNGTKTLRAYALCVTLLDCLETNIISIGGEGKYLNKILKRSIQYAGNGTHILTLNILPIDRLIEYFERFGFLKDRTYFIRENNVMTNKIEAFRLIKEV